MAQKTQQFNPRQNMNGDSYEIFHYLDMASRHLEAHYHEFYELYFFVDGDVDYWIEGSVYNLEPGDILLIRPMEMHKPISLSDTDRYERIVLWIDKTYLTAIGGGEMEKCFASDRRLLRPTSGESRRLSELLRRLVDEYYNQDIFSRHCAYGLLLQLMTLVNRNVRDSSGGEVDSTPTFISDVLSYINTHYRENLTLERLAAHFFINKYYLSHEFRKAVGTGIHRYITLKRLHYAYDALREGQSAGEVASQCGFADYTAFYKAFKAEYGISPTATAHQSNP